MFASARLRSSGGKDFLNWMRAWGSKGRRATAHGQTERGPHAVGPLSQEPSATMARERQNRVYQLSEAPDSWVTWFCGNSPLAQPRCPALDVEASSFKSPRLHGRAASRTEFQVFNNLSNVFKVERPRCAYFPRIRAGNWRVYYDSRAQIVEYLKKRAGSALSRPVCMCWCPRLDSNQRHPL